MDETGVGYPRALQRKPVDATQVRKQSQRIIASGPVLTDLHGEPGRVIAGLRRNDGAILHEPCRVSDGRRLLQSHRRRADSRITGDSQLRQGPASLLAVLGNWR